MSTDFILLLLIGQWLVPELKVVIDVIVETMTNIRIEKPGEGVFLVKIASANRAAAEKELQEFIGGRSYTRYVDHFNPNNQIIQIHQAQKV